MVTSSPGVAVLGTGLKSREFPQVEHPLLCKRKRTLCHPGSRGLCTADEHANIFCKRSTGATLSACSLLLLSSPGTKTAAGVSCNLYGHSKTISKRLGQDTLLLCFKLESERPLYVPSLAQLASLDLTRPNWPRTL